MTGAIAELMALVAWVCVLPLLFYGLFGRSFNYWLAAEDAALLIIYFAIEFGHGGGNPVNRSGL